MFACKALPVVSPGGGGEGLVACAGLFAHLSVAFIVFLESVCMLRACRESIGMIRMC